MFEGFDRQLDLYASLALKIGVNLQPGQRLLIVGFHFGGLSLHAAPLVRAVTGRAYEMGARIVDCIWEDEQMLPVRFRHSGTDMLKQIPETDSMYLICN